MKIENLEGEYTELWSYYGDDELFVDSIRFGENGLANYYSKESLKRGLYKIVLPNTNSFELIITEPKVVLQTDLVTPGKSMVIKKSQENKYYYELKKFVSSKRVEMNQLLRSHKDGALSSILFNEQSTAITREIKEYKLNVVTEAKGLLVSDLLLSGINPEIDTTLKEPYADYLEQYLNHINFGSSALLHSPVMDRRTVEYVDLLVAPYPYEKIEAINNVLNRCKGSPVVETYFVERFIERYESLQTVGYDEIFSFLVTNYIDKTDYTESKKSLLRSKSDVVSQFLRGKEFAITGIKEADLLDNLTAKYTLVVLWGETTSKKQLELIYDFSQSYAKYDLKVFSISVGDDLVDLNIGQINKWVNVKGDSKVKLELLMKANTMLILLDRDKKVIARDIDLDFLIDTLDAWER